MEELLQLREHLEHQRYAEAMDLLGEMEALSHDDKVNKIHKLRARNKTKNVPANK